jgi:hypothetical protein
MVLVEGLKECDRGGDATDAPCGPFYVPRGSPISSDSFSLPMTMLMKCSLAAYGLGFEDTNQPTHPESCRVSVKIFLELGRNRPV